MWLRRARMVCSCKGSIEHSSLLVLTLSVIKQEASELEKTCLLNKTEKESKRVLLSNSSKD